MLPPWSTTTCAARVATGRAAAPGRRPDDCGTRRRARRASRSGKRSASAARNCGPVCGALGEQRTGERQHGLEVDARERGRELASAVRARGRARAERAAGGARQSSAVTRWIVPRITTMRTSARVSRRRDDRFGDRRASNRDHRPTYGFGRNLGLHPDQVLDHRQRPAGRPAPGGAGGPGWPGSGPGRRARPQSRGHPARPNRSPADRFSPPDRLRGTSPDARLLSRYAIRAGPPRQERRDERSDAPTPEHAGALAPGRSAARHRASSSS